MDDTLRVRPLLLITRDRPVQRASLHWQAAIGADLNRNERGCRRHRTDLFGLLYPFPHEVGINPMFEREGDTETPGSKQAATRRPLDAGSYRRRPSRPTSRTCSF
jgi:hypothetical protein